MRFKGVCKFLDSNFFLPYVMAYKQGETLSSKHLFVL